MAEDGSYVVLMGSGLQGFLFASRQLEAEDTYKMGLGRFRYITISVHTVHTCQFRYKGVDNFGTL